MNMKTVTIRLTMMTDNVKNFVRLVNRYPYDMDLRSGRYVVDAKSILGIFSIDLSRPITMTIYSDDCDDLLRDLFATWDGDLRESQLDDLTWLYLESAVYLLELPNTTPETVGARQHPGAENHRQAANVLTAFLRTIL